MILNIEGDRHGRLRRLVSQAFTPMAVDELRARMRAIVVDLVDVSAPAGAGDFMAASADLYPPKVMFERLGIPEEEAPQFLEWGKPLALTLSYSAAEHLEAIDAARIGLYAATDWLCASRRHLPGDDLISRLVAAADDGDRLTTQELRSMVFALVVGGQDTTRNQLGLAMILFARHPDQWALLARPPELAARATEEAMRLAPAVPFIWRTAAEDLVWRDLAGGPREIGRAHV